MRKLKKPVLTLVVLLLLGFIIIAIPESRNRIMTAHFTLLFSSSIDTGKIVGLAAVLESNYERIGSDLQTSPAERIEVNIYAQRWRYIMATKNWGGSGNIEGISKLHFVEQAWGEADSRKVAIHEFAHTVTLKLLLEQAAPTRNSEDFDEKFATFPTWLWEAISVYEAQQFVDPKFLPYFTNGRPLTLTELNDRSKGGKIYSCGYTIIEYILQEYEREGLIKLITNYGNLQTTFNKTEEQFSNEWYEFVKTKYL